MTENKTETDLKAQAQRESYSEATTKLREKHRSDFNDLVKKAMQTRGFDWSPKPTAEEKAEAELQRLLDEHPNLKAKFSHVAEQPDD